MTNACLSVIAAASANSLHDIRPPFLVQTPPLPQCEICVVVPVKNEAELLEGTLTALAQQVDRDGYPLDHARYEVILLANNCSDRSATIARQFAANHSTFVLHIVEKTLAASDAYIGWVRKLLMDEAYHRLMALDRHKGVIASTDGDTHVAPNWIAATLSEIAHGADAVGGRIMINRRDRADLHPYARSCHLREVGYRFLIAELEAYLDPNPFDGLPRHFQHYGASFAVTAAMYGKAGGLPPVRTSEDVALYHALVRVNARFRHSPFVKVTTSARQVGRAQNGLANQLQQWVTMGAQQQPFWVESAGAIAARFQARYKVRHLWQAMVNGYQPHAKEIALPAKMLGIDRSWLKQALVQQTSCGALLEQIEQEQKQDAMWQQPSLVRIEQAMDELRLLLEPLRRQKISLQSQQYLHDHLLHSEMLPLIA